MGARESLNQSPVDALHFVLKHAERHQDKDRLWGVARRGADVSRERALSFLFRTKKVEVRGVDVGKIL